MAARNLTFDFDSIPIPVEFPIGGETERRRRLSWTRSMGSQLLCGDCGKWCPRRGNVQKYCEPCSSIRDVARKLKWAKSHPEDPEKTRLRSLASGRKLRTHRSAAGAEASKGNRADLSEVFPDETGMAWVRRVSVPFSYAMSKNHIYRMTSEGHVNLRKGSREKRVCITDAIRAATADVKVVTHKLYIDLIVHKPNHRGDAINIVNMVCDGIKDAIPVDDRWYAFKGLDWRVVKDAPELLIGIGQSATEDHRVCSYCGRILPFGEFAKNKSMYLGISRTCLECGRVAKSS